MTRRKKTRRLRDLLRAAAKKAPGETRERKTGQAPASQRPRKAKERFANAGRKQKLALGLIRNSEDEKADSRAPRRQPRLRRDPKEVAEATRKLLEGEETAQD